MPLLLSDYAPKDRKERIGYVVLPPGHGKSHRHTSVPGLIEADSVFPHDGDPTLIWLRSRAKKTGNWVAYDNYWAARIEERLTDHRWVIMVPAASVGEALGGTQLGSAQLNDDQWARNLGPRGLTPVEYYWCLQDDTHTVRFDTNADLDSWIKAIVEAWL